MYVALLGRLFQLSSISYDEARALVLARLRQAMVEMPVAERARPRYIINFKPYSVLDLIALVERDAPEIREYVEDQAKYMGYVVE